MTKTILMEQLFKQISQKGEYFLSDLALRLQVDEVPLEMAAISLASLSDFYDYDPAQKRLITRTAYTPLDQASIIANIPSFVAHKMNITTLFVTESTNLELIQRRERIFDIDVVVAEMQKKGRGRREKSWVSPLAKNLYFSLKCRFPLEIAEQLSSLSLYVGFILLQALEAQGIHEAKLKWPNDIWVQGQKIAGILIESQVRAEMIEVVIGIGVNNHQDHTLQLLDNLPTCCEAIVGRPIDRNRLVAALVESIVQLSQAYLNGATLPDLVGQWSSYSYFYGKKVQLIADNTTLFGEEIGIDRSGALLIKTEDGKIQHIYSGDYSLRAR